MIDAVAMLKNVLNHNAWGDSKSQLGAVTILEAKCFGVPSIGPPIGGPIELLTNDYDGYCLDSRDVENVYRHIKKLSDDRNKLAEMRANAIESTRPFRSNVFEKNISTFLYDIKTDSRKYKK